MATATINNIYLAGGRLCLDFINTGVWTGNEQHAEYLSNYNDVLIWIERNRLFSRAHEQEIKSTYLRSLDNGHKALTCLIELRERLRMLFTANTLIGSGDILQSFNDIMSDGVGSVKLDHTVDGFKFGGPIDLFKSVAGPVCISAAELLTSPDLERVSVCRAEPCGWFFVDTSKSRTRRWCTMEICGNRSKARSHYARRQGRLTKSQ